MQSAGSSFGLAGNRAEELDFRQEVTVEVIVLKAKDTRRDWGSRR